MRLPNMMSLCVVAGLLPIALAQQGGWQKNQVNATMCMWQQLRATVLRDTLYMDGGYLYWTPGMADGSYGSATNDDNPLGLVYTLNFSTPFNMSQNISAVFHTLEKAAGGDATNIAPNYYDGALLGNDDEFFLYGGLLTQDDAYDAPDGQTVRLFEKYQYGVEKPNFRAGSWVNIDLTSDLTRYITYGGAANAPSENKAFYFSGMQSADHGAIYYPGGNDSTTATNVSNTLITLDMSTQGSGKWANVTLPDSIPGRANPELVWVPVGSQGILVALGGVVYPDFDNAAVSSVNETGSENESPAFMSNINIYDIAAGQWYTQPTTGGPSQLTRGCAVMQPAQDYSSFSIYYYGGYDGLHSTDSSAFKDDVWVLSLPAFMWMKVASGRSGKGRAGHKCVMPYPDQMMVIGGYPAQAGVAPTCVGGDIVELFNVSSTKWLDRYDPNVWYNYEVPNMIYQRIGGDESGGATSTTPAPTGWATTALASVFATAYPTSKLTTYYPYAAAATNSTTLPTYTPHSGSGSSVPGYLPPLLGVILGLIFVSSIVVGFLVWRRRKYLKKNGGTSEMTDENGHRILSWIRGQTTETKAPTVTTTEDNTGSPGPEVFGLAAYPYQQQFQECSIQTHEMDTTPIRAELMDTSKAVELSDTALTPVDIIRNHTRVGSGRRNDCAQGNSSYAYSSLAATDHASMVSSNSAAGGGAVVSSPPHAPFQPQVRPDSPALPTATGAAAAGQDDDDDDTPRPHSATRPGPSANFASTAPSHQASRGESGVSAFSERDRAHLRNTSDPATVSTMEGTIGSPKLLPQQIERVVSPPIAEEGGTLDLRNSQPLGSSQDVVSPPNEGEVDGEDYISLRSRSAVVSPVTQTGPHGASTSPSRSARRSIFRENKEDMGGSG